MLAPLPLNDKQICIGWGGRGGRITRGAFDEDELERQEEGSLRMIDQL